jgi:hypothetical protein
MWCWRRMEKISWTEHVRNEKVLLRFKEQMNILHEIIKRRLIGLVTFCVETAFYNGDVIGRRGRKRRKLLDYFKEREDTLI